MKLKACVRARVFAGACVFRPMVYIFFFFNIYFAGHAFFAQWCALVMAYIF